MHYVLWDFCCMFFSILHLLFMNTQSTGIYYEIYSRRQSQGCSTRSAVRGFSALSQEVHPLPSSRFSQPRALLNGPGAVLCLRSPPNLRQLTREDGHGSLRRFCAEPHTVVLIIVIIDYYFIIVVPAPDSATKSIILPMTTIF